MLRIFDDTKLRILLYRAASDDAPAVAEQCHGDAVTAAVHERRNILSSNEQRPGWYFSFFHISFFFLSFLPFVIVIVMTET